jgi:hypothetical protein
LRWEDATEEALHVETSSWSGSHASTSVQTQTGPIAGSFLVQQVSPVELSQVDTVSCSPAKTTQRQPEPPLLWHTHGVQVHKLSLRQHARVPPLWQAMPVTPGSSSPVDVSAQ